MRILMISHYFPPEEPPIAFLALELAKKLFENGHEVDVVTGIPNWPSGKIFKGFEGKKFIHEDINGIKIHRLPYLGSPGGNFVRRVIDFKSFELLVRLYKRKLRSPDIIYVIVPPNEDGLAARFLAKYYKCPYILNIQDIHPDTAIRLGYIKNKLIINLLKLQVKKVYHDAKHLVTVGKFMKKRLVNNGVASEKISVVPNWIDVRKIQPEKRINKLRQNWSISEDKVIVLYAGTFGRIHGTSILLDVAKEFQQHNNVLFLLVGQGVGFNELQEKTQNELHSNILMKPFVPRENLSHLQGLADISIVLSKKGFGSTSVPSKVLGYMAAARPILAAIDQESDTASLIKSADAGIVVEPENKSKIVNALMEMMKSKENLAKWGNNARFYVEKNLNSLITPNIVVKILESNVKEANYS